MLQTKPKALLIDITRCIGCKACVGACMAEHGLTGDPDKVVGLSARSLTAVVKRGELNVRELCRHCETPSCASVCPVKAFHKTAAGPVVYDASRCMGCRYCMQACPFNVPKFTWDRPVPSVVKCDFCAARQAKGLPTACAEACPVEATVFGTREELLAEAHKRITDNPGKYYDHVYGEHEAGGTSMLFLSPVPFEELGFRVDVPQAPLPALTQAALGKIPGIATVGGSLLFGIWWITQRREEVARAEAAEAEAKRLAKAAKKEDNHEHP